MFQKLSGGGGTRNSSFELLRIISMLLIVASHFSVHGVRQVLWAGSAQAFSVWSSASVFNRAVLSVCSSGGTVGVGIFFMLTGYFMAKKNAAPFKLVRLLLQMVFYAVFALVLYLVASRLFHYPFPEFKQRTILFRFFVQCIIPMTGGAWWFASAYFFLYLLSPALNYVLCRLNKNGARILILLVFVFWYAPLDLGFELNFFFSRLQRGIFFYLLGAYFALFPNQNESGKKYMCLFAAVFFYLAISTIDFVSGFSGSESTVAKMAWRCLKEAAWCLVPFATCFLFAFFKRISIQSRLVNTVAATTFGVYLIHDSEVGRAFIWNFIVRPLGHVRSPFFFAFALFAISGVFLVCALIDYLRIRLVERSLLPPIQSLYEKFRRKFAALN